MDSYTCQYCFKDFKKESLYNLHLSVLWGRPLTSANTVVNVHVRNSICKVTYGRILVKNPTFVKFATRLVLLSKIQCCQFSGDFSKAFSQNSSHRTHMKLHTGRTESCDLCGKTFCRVSELSLHLLKHTGEKPHLCPICGSTFARKSHLTEHCKLHSDVRPHKCDYRCGLTFKSNACYTQHLLIHTGVKKFKCGKCSYACFKRYRLSQHMKIHAADYGEKSILDKKFACRICDKRFCSANLLKCHMSSTHNAII